MEERLIFLLTAALGKTVRSADTVKILDCLPLAQKHGVANMLYYALPYLPAEQQPQGQERKLLKELAYAAAAREAVQERELDALLERFEAEKLPILPLKGCILKALYPKPGMRYMSDVDLLFDEKQALRVRKVMQDLGYETVHFEQGDTDFYISPTRLNYELHRSLRDEGCNESSRRFLETLLSSAEPREGKTCILELPPEEHYAYLLCHFVKHLLNGGIGVRQVMDIYICKHGWSFDGEKLAALLEQLELTEFAAKLEQLAECWFGGGAGDAVTDELGAYILGSGTFGTDEQRVADRILKEQESNNRVRYVLRRVFLPYKTMCAYFPSLKKVPFLLPFYWIFRILRGIFCRRQKLFGEMNTVLHTPDEAVNERAAFFRRCGLKIYDKR